MQWKLAEVENNFIEVAKLALSEGPQEVICQDDNIVVVAKTEFEKMTGEKLVFKPDFKAFLMEAPGIKDLDLARDVSPRAGNNAMMVLLDTCVLAEIQHPQGDAKVKGALAAIDNDNLHISVISLGEIVRGIALCDDKKRKREVSLWIQALERDFAGRILPIRSETSHIWGELTAKAQSQRRIVSVSDGLIAATAIRYGLHIMTRNAVNYESTGAMVINPWE